jgi:D-glycero-D-manno-heptose 1,7-bisphosphate phosphatase
MSGGGARPAVFLDRDGTLIELVHHLTDPAEVALIPGAAGAVRRLRQAGFAAVVVTNQSVIGRGRLDEAGLGRVHRAMNRQLAAEGAALDAIYFCPLAPTQDDPTVVENPMRKPGPGMLLQAARDLGLDLRRSFMVGDTVSDILAGRHAGCETVLVRTGYGAAYTHDRGLITCEADDIAEAADIILGRFKAWPRQ